MTYEQIKAAVEQEAREKYPLPEVDCFKEGRSMERMVAVVMQAAYVEGKMSMMDEIEKTWDESQKRTTWEFIVPDEAKAPPSKAEYINNLFKK